MTGNDEVTYNFTVDDFHTYYVTEYGILVHNDCFDLTFGGNYKKKVRKHINQIRNRTEGVFDDIPSPGKGGFEVIENIISERVKKGGGIYKPYAGEPAIFYPDGKVVYVIRENGQFWTILDNFEKY